MYAPPIAAGFAAAVGHTPLIELKRVSQLTGCRILAKAEHLGAGGSVKDRPAAHMVSVARARGELLPPEQGGFLVEATGGNTGVGLALVAAALLYPITLVMPETVAQEKQTLMRAVGAKVITQPCVPFTDPRHFYNVAKRIAADSGGKGFWTNQFENTANMYRLCFAPAPPGAKPTFSCQTDCLANMCCVLCFVCTGRHTTAPRDPRFGSKQGARYTDLTTGMAQQQTQENEL